jgi:hypothetical protein
MYEVTGVGEAVKTTKTKIIYEDDLQYNGKWVYAKNLVEERIALAAAHVFGSFADADYYVEECGPYAKNFLAKYEQLKSHFDPSMLSRSVGDDLKVFYVAYGSYKSASKKNTQVKYIQPLLSFSLNVEVFMSEDGTFHTRQKVTKAWRNLKDRLPSGICLSLTDTHDPFTCAYYEEWPKQCNYEPFSILNYALTYSPLDTPQFHRLTDDMSLMFMPYYYGENIPLVMTQLSLKDHGKPASGYELVSKQVDPDSQPDYWASIAASTRMEFYDGKSWVSTPVTE